MLRSLRIRDFAIIDSLELEFEPGMGVLTGETGAGKSIIIDALGLVLGGRAHAEFVRTGASETRVEALFDVENRSDIIRRLADRDIAEGSELVVRRTVSLRGPNRADINGRMTPVGVLSDITSGLVDIYGQHEHHSLLRPESHLEMLDSYGGLVDLYDRYRSAWQAVRDTEKRIEEASRSESERAARLDYLRFVVSEIDSADPSPGEMERLHEEREVLRNARLLKETAAEAHETLYGADDAVTSRLASLADRLRQAAGLDSRLEPIVEAVDSARFTLEDAGLGARDYAAGVEENPQRIEQVEDRIGLLGRLLKKYGGSIEAVIEHRKDCAEEAVRLEEGEQSIEELKRKLDEELKTARRLAGKLTEKRRIAAKKLCETTQTELGDLGMAQADFEVRFHPATEVDGLGPEGAETAEFYIAPNPGEELKPLIKIASGGELSRIMLALKTILVGTGDVPTLIFDEVDSGIGGGAAEIVGRKLSSLARRAQVLCVTHLAQIAAFAQNHYFVSKYERKGRTVTRVKHLEKRERIEEVARMLGGVEVTDATRTLAKEMITGMRNKE